MKITFTEAECQVRTPTNERYFLPYEDYPEMSALYDQAVEIAGTYRTPEQIRVDELAEFAIMADPEGALDIVPDWEPWVQYRVGEHVVYEGKIYRVLQTHRSQYDWPPPEVPALYTIANKTTTDPVGNYPKWAQPTGAHDAYNTGDRVTWGDKIYESLNDGNTWNPTDYPIAWKEIEEAT